jgi:hypothetical protein
MFPKSTERLANAIFLLGVVTICALAGWGIYALVRLVK